MLLTTFWFWFIIWFCMCLCCICGCLDKFSQKLYHFRHDWWRKAIFIDHLMRWSYGGVFRSTQGPPSMDLNVKLGKEICSRLFSYFCSHLYSSYFVDSHNTFLLWTASRSLRTLGFHGYDFWYFMVWIVGQVSKLDGYNGPVGRYWNFTL